MRENYLRFRWEGNEMDKLESRTFEHFPANIKCPLCGDGDDGICVLVGIEGTQDGGNIECLPVHLACLSNPKRYLINREVNVLYAVTVEVED